MNDRMESAPYRASIALRELADWLDTRPADSLLLAHLNSVLSGMDVGVNDDSQAMLSLIMDGTQ